MHQKSSLTILWSILFAGVALRALLLALPAFVDTTDARYAAIGLEMVTTGNWVTPYVNQGAAIMPYWSKPPLGFWMTAGSYQLFGISEWAARLPSFLSTLLMVALTMLLAERWWGKSEALLAGIILLSSILVFFMAGACTMDAALGACVTGAFVSFALAIQEPKGRQSAWWGRAFFVALALGVLAKGPIAIIFVGIGIFFWALKTGRWGVLLSLPWLSGPLLFLLVAAPWYYLAEKATPGFLEYFWGNENFSRLVSKNLEIKYGRGHKSPLGAVWPMLALAFFPWILSLLLPLLSSEKRRSLRAHTSSEFIFAVTWGLGPVIFLSFGKQVVATYLVPMLPGLALAVAYLVVNAERLSVARATELFNRAVAVLLIVSSIALMVRYSGTELAGINWIFATIFLLLIVLTSRAVFRTTSDCVRGTAWTGATLFLTFGLVVSLIHTEVTSMRSTRPVFDYLLRVPPNRASVIAFLNEIPDSAQVYRKLWYEKGFKVVGIPPEKADSREIDFLVGRAGDLEKLALTAPRDAVFESRKWRVMRLRIPSLR